MEMITSRANPLIARIRRLERDRAFRRQSGLVLCEGVKLWEEALRWGAAVDTVLFTEERRPAHIPEGVRAVQVPAALMESISPVKTPQGLLFLVRRPEAPLPERLEGRRYLLLDGVQDPGNVGTIWRTADAFGADGLLLTGGCADPWHWKTVRASMGAVFRLPVWEAETAALGALLARSDLPLYGTALREDTVDVRTFAGGAAVVALGSEGRGLSDEVLALCRQTWRIPMRPRCESLNVGVAAAVVLWELGRAAEDFV